MKGKKWIVIVAAFILLLALPIPTGAYHDGKIKSYTALTYKIVDRERCREDGSVYNETTFYAFPMNFMSADFLIASTNVPLEKENFSVNESGRQESETLTEPPALKVMYDEENNITLNPSSYCWTYIDKDGERKGICVDGLHPSKSKELMEVITPSSKEVKMIFDSEPDSLTVRCWQEEEWGEADAQGEQLRVENGKIFLKPGKYIYQVTGVWNDGALDRANASYSFCAALN